MSGLRDLALAKLAKAGQRAGHSAGQGLSHSPDFGNPGWDSKNGGNLPQSIDCPAVPSPRAWDSGTAPAKAGQRAGHSAGQHGADPRLAASLCREWRAELIRLDPLAPRHGLAVGRWGTLLGDADWLLDHFGNQAGRDGWSALDLFGVIPGRDGWGGLADRLRASRSLVMGADVARWRRVINGEPESFARGLGGTAQMIALWEVG